ncbi:MAG: hypothetical protein R2744_11920 [Bacteroidales bacterium]
MDKYAIGADFGTLSGRSLIVNVKNGEELPGIRICLSPRVMDKKLPDGTKLGVDWAPSILRLSGCPVKYNP